ncbi:MAG: tRNA (adenosine(37)-N6)-dimethylallyltransferase MiaA [Bdellovibrionota bacterium]
MLNHKPLILITGATCSGKSSLAVKLAKAISAEIVSIDSVQVYKGFNIGSAKITKEEMQGIEHYLLDVLEPNSHFDVAKYLKLARKAISNIYDKDKNVIIVGGTTMYITPLIHGLATLKSSDKNLRERLEKKETSALYALLKRLDGKASKSLSANDRTRIIRALEVKILSNKSIKDVQKEHSFLEKKYDCLAYVICQKREELYNNINERTRKLIDLGLIEETKKLLEKYDKNLAPFLSIGYKQAVQYIEQKISKDGMIEDIAKRTRNLAKRQMTYFRNEPEKRGWDIFPKYEDNKASMILSDNSTIVGKGTLKDFLVYNYTFNELVDDIKTNMKNGIKGVRLSYISPKCLL